jgi:predicted Zn-dependent protease with MMP-like domain
MAGDEPRWLDARAPGLDEIEIIARDAFLSLPQLFQDACDSVIFHVTEFPDEAVVKEMALETPFDILGLFTGVSMPERNASQVAGQMPNNIHLYSRPILDYWAEHDETLGHIITHVLIHEIGHQLGLSDGQLEAIEEKG